ncbi:hypothetical protein ACFL2M_01075 [Patescibacteria group bacterium]
MTEKEKEEGKEGKTAREKEPPNEWKQRIRLTVLVLIFFMVLGFFGVYMYGYMEGDYTEESVMDAVERIVPVYPLTNK